MLSHPGGWDEQGM